MNERLRFVGKLLDGEAMSDVCRQFGISRKTGYKIFNRYKQSGFEALSDRCRRPVRYANQLPPQIESVIVTFKREKPHWGARKIRELLLRRLDQDLRIPAKSTIHAVLHRHGLVKGIRRARHRATGTALSEGIAPNDLWCADFKGEFKLGNGRYCYPLTVTDHASRYLLMCEALESTRRHSDHRLRATVPRAWSPGGHPLRQRGSVRQPERAVQSLEAFRMVAASRYCDRAHKAWTPATERPARAHALDAQEGSDAPARCEQSPATRTLRRLRARVQWRPSARSIGDEAPAQIYSPSPRPYTGLPDLSYPLHDREVVVTACGRICMYRKRINLSHVLAGQRVGIKEVDDGIWIVSFMHYDLGYIDLEQKTLQPLDNPFGARLLPMS